MDDLKEALGEALEKMSEKELKEKRKMRVWWNSNFGKPAFRKDIKNIKEAKYIITLLTAYDLYLEDKIVANACGVEVCEMNHEGQLEWSEFYDDEGRDINEIMDEEERIARGEE